MNTLLQAASVTPLPIVANPTPASHGGMSRCPERFTNARVHLHLDAALDAVSESITEPADAQLGRVVLVSREADAG